MTLDFRDADQSNKLNAITLLEAKVNAIGLAAMAALTEATASHCWLKVIRRPVILVVNKTPEFSSNVSLQIT